MSIYIVNAFVWMLEFTSPGSLLRHFVLLVSSRSSMKSKELCRTPWRWGPDMNLAVETEALTFMWTWHVSSIAPGCGGSASATTCREDRWGTRQKWRKKCREDRSFVDSLFLWLPRGTKDIRRREDHPSAQSDWDRGWDGGPESGVVFAVADKFVRENRGYDLDEIYLWPRFLLC